MKRYNGNRIFICVMVVFLSVFSLAPCFKGNNYSDNFSEFSKNAEFTLLNLNFSDKDKNPSSTFTNLIAQTDICLSETPVSVTPEKLKSKCEIYKCINDCQTFMVYRKTLHVLGDSFGGHGVTQLAFANDNGKEYLIYCFSFGSGIHRSLIGVFDFAAKKSYVSDKCWRNKDICLGYNKNGTLLVSETQEFVQNIYYADFNEFTVSDEFCSLKFAAADYL